MNQQMTWRCGQCEDVVSTYSEATGRSPFCPTCGALKDRVPEPFPGDGPPAYDSRAGTRFAQAAGPELDRLLARRVLGTEERMPAAPYCSEDLAAMALAELVGRQSAWSFHLAFCGETWMATFTEKSAARKGLANLPVSSLVSASGRSRALAISRALLKVTRCPRWKPLGMNFLETETLPRAAAGAGDPSKASRYAWPT